LSKLALGYLWSKLLTHSSPERSLDEERVQIEAKKKEREGQHPFLTVKVITDETFARHEGFDLADFDEKELPLSDLPTFRVLKQETYSVFKSRVAQHFCYPESQMRLWVFGQPSEQNCATGHAHSRE
jgi:ubiquitin carboxyl-terminal hydrolase 7